ncbi:hypothetical protein GCM10027594_02570 [Hymenobacter agri]
MTNSTFQKTLLACFVQAGSVLFIGTAQAQNTSEIGVGLGATNYRGELSPTYQFQNNRPALTAFYRKDVSVPITLRGGLTAGLLRADDGNVSGVTGAIPPLQAYRQANTKGWLAEGSAVVEYNFLNFHRRTDRIHFSPYLFAGVAVFYANTTTVSNAGLVELERNGGMIGFAVPMGVGAKLALSTHWNLGLEIGARKALTDQLDHLGDQSQFLVNPHDQDWYYYNGLSLSYTFYKIHCPDSYKQNKELLK